MSTRVGRRWTALFSSIALIGAMLVVQPLVAHADGEHVLPGNEGDVGAYTDGQADSMDIGLPTYQNVAPVAAALDPGVPYTADNMYQSIFEQDLENGGSDYYLDRVLGVKGAGSNIPTILQTRGRSLYMRGASNNNFTTMGFAGTAYAGGPNNLGNFYTVTVPGQTVAEQSANRFNAPSHMSDTYTIGTTGVVADLNKFITYDNVAVTTITFTNPGESDATFTVRTASPIATQAADAPDEFTGRRVLTSGANNGLNDTAWSTVTVGLKASGFTRNGTNLEREVTVPAGGSLDLSVVGVLYSDTLPDSRTAFYDYADMDPAVAFRTGVTDFNQRWASDIPYIDVPDPAIEKAIVYRWWGERYNSLDANEPGYVYQYPTTIEGVNLYQNAVVLTQPMHLQDTKWIRNPYLAYGQILNVGELSGSSAFLDSPGHTSWNNHYSQYIGTSGLEAYNVHGGGPEIAERFANYFEGDGVGQLEHYDGNDNNLIAYDTFYMPGNDADAISFGFPKSTASAPGARTIERPESAYVWGDFNAAAQLYEMAGDSQDVVDAARGKADDIRDSILENLWSPTMRMFLAGTSYGATSAATANGQSNPLPTDERSLIPARESNLYDVYAENLIPVEDAQTYEDGFRFLRYGDNFPIFPFYTANQFDRAAYGIGGSNNFSNINFTVQYRGVRSALRYYDPDQKYVTPEYAEHLLQWMAWSIYPGGDLLAPNQAEYYSNWNPETQTYNRNNPYHVMLGNMNYIYIEDMAGVQPRSDDVIQLWPIDLGYDHFMVNNLRYHDHDVTIVWDADGTHYGLGQGYSLFVDGAKKVTSDKLGKLTYDPNTNEVSVDSGMSVTFQATDPSAFPTAVATQIQDPRVVSYLKTAGIDLTEDAANLAAGATLSSSHTQQGTRPTPWRDFHTPGSSTSAMNYTPGAIKVDERPVSLDAVTDGQTVNEPYWGNYGTTDPDGYVELNFGTQKKFDNVKVYFVSDRQAGGYREPAKYTIQIPDGHDGWQALPDVYKSPKIPGPKFNEALFQPVTADRMRISFLDSPSYYTAISEIQVFDSGRDVPAVVNDPPNVTAAVDATKAGNLSTGLIATLTDDGIPDGGVLTYGWETVSAPEGAAVIFNDAGALSTTVTGTVAGDYVFRFWADDGEAHSEKTVTVTLESMEVSAEFGASAIITTSGAAAWENPSKVNAKDTPRNSNPGAGNGWGNWGQNNNGTSTSKEAWIQYSWDEPVLLTSTGIYWYDDNGGTRTPRADTYSIEYTTDGTTWSPVELTGSSNYAGGIAKNTYNHFDFTAIQARAMRIRIWGIQSGGAGTGVLRWRVNGDTVASVMTPVIMRTTTGVNPELPEQLGVTYSSGVLGTVKFTWQDVTLEMVSEPNVEPFSVFGTNSQYGLVVEAQIYVRPETADGGIAIQGAQEFQRQVDVGEQPQLPERVLVSYNDGSRDNQAIGVQWQFDESMVEVPGVYTVVGDLVLPPYVSSSGTVHTTLVLTVGDGGDSQEPGDGGGAEEPGDGGGSASGTTPSPSSPRGVDRIAGQDRYQTANEIAKAFVAALGGTNAIILANGLDGKAGFDALSAGYLAGAQAAPIVLNTAGGLSESLKQTIRNALNGAARPTVYVMGGSDSLSAGAIVQLQALVDAEFGNGAATVRRIAGPNRYATSAQIARTVGKDAIGKFVLTAGAAPLRTAILTSGEVNADALAATPISSALHVPILLSTSGGSLPTSVASAISDLGIEQVIVLGNTDRISTAAVRQLASLGVTSVKRIEGADRFDTAVLLYQFAIRPVNGQGLGYGTPGSIPVYLANGVSGFTDALTIGPFAGLTGSIVLTVPGSTIPDSVRRFLAGQQGLSSVTALGQADRVSADSLRTAQQLIG